MAPPSGWYQLSTHEKTILLGDIYYNKKNLHRQRKTLRFPGKPQSIATRSSCLPRNNPCPSLGQTDHTLIRIWQKVNTPRPSNGPKYSYAELSLATVRARPRKTSDHFQVWSDSIFPVLATGYNRLTSSCREMSSCLGNWEKAQAGIQFPR